MIIVDYKSTTLRTNPSISVARKVLAILQHHYVETLGRAIVVNLPVILSFFYKGIAPFLDPVTRDKMRFNPDLFELVPREQLDADFGGDYEYEFEPESYWNQLIEYVIMLVLVAISRFFYHLRKTDGGAHAVQLISTGHVASRLTARALRKHCLRRQCRPNLPVFPVLRITVLGMPVNLFITALIINLMICS